MATADLDGEEWLTKSRRFAAGYLKGFADVVAVGMGHNPGSDLAANLSIRFAEVIAVNAPCYVQQAFIEYMISKEQEESDIGFDVGRQDGQGVLNGIRTPRALASYLGVSDPMWA